MSKQEKLKSLHIDVENGVYKVNGRDISDKAFFLELTFKNGTWSLMITEDRLYTTNDQDITE